jgi:hypothetical protein
MALLFFKINRIEVTNYHYHEVDRQKTGQGAGALFPDPKLT